MQIKALAVALLGGLSPTFAQRPVHHDLAVGLDPVTHSLEVRDVLRLPDDIELKGVELVLSEALVLRSSTPTLKVIGTTDGRTRYGIADPTAGFGGTLTIEYGGPFDFGLSAASDEYTRGFRESRGALGPEGVYLHGGSRWIPDVEGRMVTFAMDVNGPADWHLISQGGGDSQVSEGRAHWESSLATDEIYIVGGPLTRFRDQAGEIEILTYFHEADGALANKYLEATAQYLQMYTELIGPYPYGKFALVENFWETGFGMPSFTLLGPQIVRFPFILHSSYPHEILHNWWGNSVFVEYAGGNWCEGLTAYMADHLIQEQRGKGARYRRGALQKYRDYVKMGRDFPLRLFISRHNAATESIGYGKSSMMFHMLRRKLGDAAFTTGLQAFYAEFQGRRANFDHIAATMAESSGQDLKGFFAQWVDRIGAPDLRLTDVTVERKGDVFTVSGTIAQVQEGAAYVLDIPVTVQMAGGDHDFTVPLEEASVGFQVEVPGTPLGVTVDPLFDVFRVLDPRETPPSIGQIFGAEAVVAILPADDPDQGMYRELVQAWQSHEHGVIFALDNELKALPVDKAVWILGSRNRFVPAFTGGMPGVDMDDSTMTLGGETVPRAGHSSVVVARHPGDPERAVGWIVLDPQAAAPGLGRKLPHYGKYSYLAFEGSDPTNVLKGQWSPDGSPLVWNIEGSPLAAVTDSRTALAETPPVFSSARMRKHIERLGAQRRTESGSSAPGSANQGTSADYIAAAFAEAGLEPGGDEHGWFQDVTVPEGSGGKPPALRNVVGILRGSNGSMAQQSVVVGARYSDLGQGGGADGSGVAVLIELARQIRSTGGGARNLVVVAFAAEEQDLLGSSHYVSAPRFPMEGVIGMISLGDVGRADDSPILVNGAGTADEWKHIFRGAGFAAGLANKIVPELAVGSGPWSFAQAGVPGVEILTGAAPEGSRPSDAEARVDLRGHGDLVQVACFVHEALVYLMEREGKMTSTPGLKGRRPR